METNPTIDLRNTIRKPADLVRAREALRAHHAGALAAERARLDDELAKRKPAPIPVAPPADGLKTPAQAARRLGISIRTLRGLITSGELRYIAVGRGKQREKMMFTDSDLDDLIAGRTRQKAQQSCPSTSQRARRSTTSTSSGEVIAFTARRKERTDAKRRR